LSPRPGGRWFLYSCLLPSCSSFPTIPGLLRGRNKGLIGSEFWLPQWLCLC
jgi:hypothetical protein